MIDSRHIKENLLGILHKSNLVPVLTTYFSAKLGKQIARHIPKKVGDDDTSDDRSKTIDFNKYRDVPPKAKRASQASKDKAREIVNSFSKDQEQELLDTIAGMGLNIGAFGKDWTTAYSNPQIKAMRAKEALGLHAEDGVDIVGLFHKYKAAQAEAKKPGVVQKVVKAVSKVFKDITDSNMFFCGNPRFRTDLAVKGSMHEKWYHAITRSEFKALSHYTKHSRNLNMWLRGKFKPYALVWSLWDKTRMPELDRIKRQTKEMDSAISKAELTEDITVWRVMDIGKNPDLLNRLLDHAKNGDLFTDDAFMSSSTLPMVNESLVDHFATKLSKFVVLKINIPKGKGRGAYIAPFSQPQYITQCEYLIGRGSQLKVDPKVTKVSRSEFVSGATETEKNSYLFECTLEGFERKDVDAMTKSVDLEPRKDEKVDVPEPVERFICKYEDFSFVSKEEHNRRKNDPTYKIIKC